MHNGSTEAAERVRAARIAPARFLLFGAVFVVVTAAAKLVADLDNALLIGFDAAAFVFLAGAIPLFGADVRAMRRAAKANDVNRVALLAISVVLSLVILAAVGALIASGTALSSMDIVLIVATLALAWLFANAVFALHYAHLFYLQASGQDRGGLNIPNAREPGFWDFLYFSFTLGMTFQTSDVDVTSRGVRKVMLFHCFAAFIFNIGVIAFTINVLGGAG